MQEWESHAHKGRAFTEVDTGRSRCKKGKWQRSGKAVGEEVSERKRERIFSLLSDPSSLIHSVKGEG
jgi:hypothetical protein